MSEAPTSERAILLARTQKIRLSQRLKQNLEEIQFKQERLSLSRVSSQSSKSGKDIGRRVASSADLRQVSPKVKLLLEISDKLKSSKHKQIETPKKTVEFQTPSPQVKKIQYSSDIKRKSKGGKLESMLKDIKRCNQMSTKAVNSIKKPFANGQSVPGLLSSQPIGKVEKESTKLEGIFNQLLLVRQELRRVKQENQLLVKLIQINEVKSKKLSEEEVERPCYACGCTCRSRKVEANVQNGTFTNGFHFEK